MEHLGVDVVGRHQPAGKQHGEHHQEHQHLHPGKVVLGQHVGAQVGDDQAGRGADHRHRYGDAVGPADDGKVCEDIPVGVHTEAPGEHGIAVFDDLRILGKGGGDEDQERHQRQKGQKEQHRMGDPVHASG